VPNLFRLQEISSVISVAGALVPAPPHSLLDACAAPAAPSLSLAPFLWADLCSPTPTGAASHLHRGPAQ